MHGILETGAGRKAKRIMAIGIGAGAAVGLLIVVGIQMAAGPRTKAENAYWTVTGPPCPTATPAEIHRIGRPVAQVMEFGEGHFARVSGAVECTDLTDGGFGLVTGTTCQFSSPRALWVSSEGGSSYYDISNGGPATVTVSRTQPPRCVMAAHFHGD